MGKEVNLKNYGFIPRDLTSMVFRNLRINNHLINLENVMSYEAPLMVLRGKAL